MASVSFSDETRGRSGKVPLSLYAPLRTNDGTPFFRAMPGNGVPTGMGKKDQQVGYWNEQVRWRMQKGQRKNLPSNWHFYYHGTGPHKDAKFREKIQGVFWVAKQGSKVAPTDLPTRKRNQPTIDPQFDFDLPKNIEIVTAPSQPNSRSNSRSQSSGGSKSRASSQSRDNSNQQKTPKGSTNNSRSNSQERSQKSKKGKGGSNQDDLVAAVRQALVGLGFQPQGNSGRNGGKKSAPSSGKSTPKDSRSKSPARPQSTKKQLDKPEWKRVPNKSESVTACFGPRDVSRNFGTKGLVAEGVEYSHFPQIAELLPTQAALAFGSRVEVKDFKDEVEIKFHYKMNVPKENKNLAVFLEQVDAYLDPSREEKPKEQRKPKEKKKEETTLSLNPAAPVFTPPVVLPDAVAQVEFEMVDEVTDVVPESFA
ncbi:nucleocapsid protein [Miniopterus pusillus bat coronavirus HKU8-related]|nr:nucleocapsid protein [Miniopterus pusillus bat coronavirus HKU8-related]